MRADRLLAILLLLQNHRQLTARALAERPADRHATCTAFTAAVTAELDGAAVPPLLPRSRGSWLRHRARGPG